jgi:2-amino-4-hydroxy-6-hydroxymethyldihydropteridine diphosphokinase
MDWEMAYIGLGSNLGDKAADLRNAIQLLGESNGCSVVRVSSLYVTRPVGVEDQPEFFNAVLELRTCLEPPDLLKACLEVERKIGRTRTIRWGPRVIDVDILLYGNASVNAEDLVIPHPRLLERAFVLIPLAEIAPELDVGGRTAAETAEIVGSEGVQLAQDPSWVN